MIVLYVPVKFDSIGQTVFELESGNENVDGQTDEQTNGQTNRRNYNNFVANLAMMVTYVPVKFEFDWTNRFRVKSENKNVDKRTNKRTELHQFRKNLAMMVICLPVKFEFDWTNRFQVRVRK